MICEEKIIWKQYPEYPSIEANQFGEIRIKDRVVTGKDGKKYHSKGHVLKQHQNQDGYMFVSFRANGKFVCLKVHRIVAACFLPNPNNLPEVNHIDCDRTNNRLDNLEWCTHQENVAYRDRLGRTAKHNAPKKPVIAVNLETFEVLWFESQHEASRQLGVYQGGISGVVKGNRNKTGDYWFCCADETAVEKIRTKFGDGVAEKVKELMKCK